MPRVWLGRRQAKEAAHKRRVIGHVHPSGVIESASGRPFEPFGWSLHLRQSDVASRAGVSQGNDFGDTNARTPRRAGRRQHSTAWLPFFQADLSVELRWRAAPSSRDCSTGGMPPCRTSSSRNCSARAVAGSGRGIIQRLGERGSVDIVAWLPGAGALLIIEIKDGARRSTGTFCGPLT